MENNKEIYIVSYGNSRQYLAMDRDEIDRMTAMIRTRVEHSFPLQNVSEFLVPNIKRVEPDNEKYNVYLKYAPLNNRASVDDIASDLQREIFDHNSQTRLNVNARFDNINPSAV